MKKITFVLFSMMISMPLWAGDPEQPNFVECGDKADTLKLVYKTTGLHGRPTFGYSRLTDGPLSRKVAASGEAIHSLNTTLGEMISVQDHASSIPDRNSNWVSLILPRIYLRNSDEVEFKTVVVETTMHSSFGGPQPGVIHDSQYFDVTCTATIIRTGGGPR